MNMPDLDTHSPDLETHASRPRIPLILVVVIGVAISLAVFFDIRSEEHYTREISFRRVADDRIDALQSSIQSSFAVLQSVRGLYAASNHVHRQEFRRFVETLGLGLGSAVQALEWIPRVSLSERPEMEALARQDGVFGFRITERQAQGDMVPAANRAEYFPVYFVEPVVGNEAAIGFDLASNPVRLEALKRTRDSGEAVATSRITLVQDTGDQYGFLVFMPIYRNGMPTDTLHNRRANLSGFALGVFRIGDLAEIATRNNSTSEFAVSLQVFDESAPAGSQRVYPKSAESDDNLLPVSALHWSRTIDVAGRTWRIVVTPATVSMFADRLWKPWIFLLAGFLFTGLLAQYLNLVQRRTADVNKLVAERTAELRTAAAGLTRSNAELEQFAYVASHDLQEPLRKVQAFSDRLRSKYESELDEQGLDYLARMHDAAARMQKLVNDLLAFSRVTSKGEDFVPTSLDSVVHEVVANLEARIEETGARVEIGDMPTINVAPLQMHQLFQNLIANALKYGRENVPPIVKVFCEQGIHDLVDLQGIPANTCRIVVEDNGMGFEQTYSERIFGIFQRLHGRGEYEGTGVGLAICRKIAERHGGTIVAQGRPGNGSTFAVTLPLTLQSLEQSGDG